MIIHNDLEKFNVANPVITIGTFDGVHLGHRKVIDQLNKLAGKIKGESVLFTFYPHPRLVLFREEANLRLITTLDEKIKQLENAGIDNLVVYPFTKDFASLTYTDFIEKILIDKLNMNTLVVGHDHHLGRNREGTYENIVLLARQKKFNVEKIDAFLIDEIGISSSKIRKALQMGNVAQANKYLGYTFSLHGKVAEGNQLGRSIGFPTANVEAADPYKLIPAEGVYAITIEVEQVIYKAMLNIGHRPTVNTNADNRTIEAHIFNFDKDIYQKNVTIYFYERIRDERKFNSLDELKAQLTLDKTTVLKALQSMGID